jgi:hypothetical protein
VVDGLSAEIVEPGVAYCDGSQVIPARKGVGTCA